MRRSSRNVVVTERTLFMATVRRDADSVGGISPIAVFLRAIAAGMVVVYITMLIQEFA